MAGPTAGKSLLDIAERLEPFLNLSCFFCGIIAPATLGRLEILLLVVVPNRMGLEIIRRKQIGQHFAVHVARDGLAQQVKKRLIKIY